MASMYIIPGSDGLEGWRGWVVLWVDPVEQVRWMDENRKGVVSVRRHSSIVLEFISDLRGSFLSFVELNITHVALFCIFSFDENS